MAGIKNELSIKLKKYKWYNPNTFSTFDAAFAFFIFGIASIIIHDVFAVVVNYLMTNGIIKDMAVVYLISLLFSQGYIFLIGFIFCKVKKVSLFSGGGYKFRFNWIDILFSVVLMMGISLFFYAIHEMFTNDIFTYIYGLDYDPSLGTEVEGQSIWIALLINLVLAPVLPAICEELLFRSVIMRGFDKFNPIACILLSSSIFMIMHGNVSQVILQFLGGVAICFVVYVTKNFLLGMVMHFANNLFVVLTAATLESFEQMVENGKYLLDAIYIIFGLVFIIVGCVYFSKKALKLYKNKILNKKASNELKGSACFIKKGNESLEFEKVEADSIDFKSIYNNKEALFFNGDRFYPIYKRKRTKATIIFLIIGFALALFSVIVSIF